MARVSNSAARQRSLVLRTIYALCLLGATYNHWVVIWQHGFGWNYGGLPKASTTFWTMLAFLDPVAVILLFTRANTGVAATAAIIVTDVIHNLWIQARYFPPLLQAVASSPQVMEQIAFMLFVVATSWLAREGRQIVR